MARDTHTIMQPACNSLTYASIAQSDTHAILPQDMAKCAPHKELELELGTQFRLFALGAVVQLGPVMLSRQLPKQ